MTAHEIRLAVSGLALLLFLTAVTCISWRFRWIVARVEDDPELRDHPLWGGLPPLWGFRAFGYVLQIGGLDFIPDSLIRYGIERGRAPGGTCKASVYRHFSAGELRRIRRAARITVGCLAAFLACALIRVLRLLD